MLLGDYKMKKRVQSKDEGKRILKGNQNQIIYDIWFQDRDKLKEPFIVDTIRKLNKPVLEIKDSKTNKIIKTVEIDIPLWVADKSKISRLRRQQIFDQATVSHHTDLLNRLKEELSYLDAI